MLMQGSENEIEASNITYHSSDLQDNIILFHTHGIAIRRELFLNDPQAGLLQLQILPIEYNAVSCLWAIYIRVSYTCN